MVNELNRTGRKGGLRRREFLKTSALVTGGALLQGPALFAASANRAGKSPNILVIITDQQFADAMSCCIGRDPAGESPAVPIARFRFVAIPQLMMDNRMSNHT